MMRNLARKLGIKRDAYAAQVSQLEQVVRAANADLPQQVQGVLNETRERWREEDELLRFLTRRATADIEAKKIERGQPTLTRSLLEDLRASDSYQDAWDEPNPLVSVRIASYQNTETLINRAVASVLRQTHQNFEIIIVNDGPNEQTREALQLINDPRIRYEEFPVRSRYPEDPHLRWMVAGSPGMNRAAELAVGKWIAPLDDDDEFSDDHIEKLLRVARSNKAEFTYGAIEQHRVGTAGTSRIFSDPPSAGQISLQAALYHAGIRFIEYDTESWRVDEPGDWNLVRRMMEADVRMAATEDYVTRVHMTHFSEKGY